ADIGKTLSRNGAIYLLLLYLGPRYLSGRDRSCSGFLFGSRQENPEGRNNPSAMGVSPEIRTHKPVKADECFAVFCTGSKGGRSQIQAQCGWPPRTSRASSGRLANSAEVLAEDRSTPLP